MAEVNVSFCSPLDEHAELYAALEELLAVYHESEPVKEARFDRLAEDDDRCTALHVVVDDEFQDSLREDVAGVIEAHHDCDVVVGQYEGETGADFVHGSCRIH